MGRPKTLREAAPGLLHTGQYLAPYLRSERLLIGGSMLALLAEVALRALEPWPLKFVFDYILPVGDGSPASAPWGLGALDPLTLLAMAAVAVVALIGLRALAAYLNTVGFALVGNRVLASVRADLYRHLQRLSLSFYTRERSGDLVVRIISDIGMLKDVAVAALMPLLGNILILVVMAGLMLWLNWKLALIAIAAVPLFWLPALRLSRRIQHVSRRQRKREGAMASTAAEAIGAIRVVQALSLEAQFADSFSGQNKKDLKEGVEAKRLAARLERTVDVLIALATALVLWYGARLVLLGSLTPGDLLVFLTYLKNAFKPLQNFAKYTGRLAKAAAAGERVIDLLEREPDVHDLPGAVDAPPFRGAITFDNVSFAYEPGQPVLKGVSLCARPGQKIALVGPSGNGKSTLVSLLLRLYDPVEGHVRIDGHDLRDYTLASLRAQVSIVMQDSLLFAASIRDNIAYGAPDASPEEIEAAARLANAHRFIVALPEGYDTVVGERGVTLSGGQRQRIAIARSAIRKAPILILDEPTTGLDEENEQAVLEALDRLARGRTTFMITHDLRQAARADLILYLEGGILERGTHAELMEQGGRYAALYRLQAEGTHHRNEEELTYADAR